MGQLMTLLAITPGDYEMLLPFVELNKFYMSVSFLRSFEKAAFELEFSQEEISDE